MADAPVPNGQRFDYRDGYARERKTRRHQQKRFPAPHAGHGHDHDAIPVEAPGDDTAITMAGAPNECDEAAPPAITATISAL